MTPEERRQDAVDAAREWRDQERGAPKKGDHIEIRWRGGPYDFEMEFHYLDESMPAPHPGWYWLHGKVGEEKTEYWTYSDVRTLYAHYVSEGVYEMVPYGGKMSDL